MKMFLTLIIAFWYGVSAAQDSNPQNSLAIVAGPNWCLQFNNSLTSGYDFDPRTGFSTGLEYTFHIDKHWHLKAGIRYNILKTITKSGWLRYESEYGPDGTYTPDPTLSHYFTLNHKDRVWQYLVGIRWMAKPKTWRWYVDAETGLTDFIEPDGVPKAKLRLTIGTGFGLAWQPIESKTAIFVQPVARYVFQVLGSDLSTVTYRYLIPAIELGARRYF